MKKILSFFAMLMLVSIFAASLMAQTPQHCNYPAGTATSSGPFGTSSSRAACWLFAAGSFINPTPIPTGKAITKVWVRTTATGAGVRDYTDMQILMAQSTITSLTTGAFYPGPWDTVYTAAALTLTFVNNEWVGITLNRNFNYDPTKSLIVFIGNCTNTGTGGGVAATYIGINTKVPSVGGCPWVATGGNNGTLNIGFDVVNAVGVIPDGKASQDNLIQNFPNPFNNYTTISYQIKENTDVVLKVFDIMGKEVSTLVNKSQTVGNYEVAFDASNLPSGIYVYQLTTSNNSISKRMVIEK